MTAFAMADSTIDAFLGGRVEAVQPARGHHRAGLEAVLLGAALPADFSGTVLDFGAGAGVAGMCLAARCPGVRVALIERDGALLAAARAALARPANRGFADRVFTVEADIEAPGAVAAGLGGGPADAVIANPPFRPAGAASASPERARAAAHVAAPGSLDRWLRAAAALLRPGGRVVVLWPADALGALLAAADGRFGGLAVLPVHPRPAVPATRVLLLGVAGSRAPARLLPGLVLHGETGGAFLPLVDSLLRGGPSLGDIHPAWRAVLSDPARTARGA